MIPRTVHYCWISNDPFPELNRNCVQSWMKFLPDYDFILWDYKKIESLNIMWLKQTIEAKKYAFAADYIRIYALFTHGGIYLDTDVELLKSFDQFLNYKFFIGFDYNHNFEPAVFGSIPGYDALSKLLEHYNNRAFIKNSGKYDIKPLPIVFKELLGETFFIKFNGKKQQIEDKGFVIFPSDYFSPKNIYFSRIKTTLNTVAIHHFEGSWVEKNRLYHVKQFIHKLLYIISGKYFHYRIIQIIRLMQLTKRF